VKERLALLWQAVEIDEALLYDRDHATELLRRIGSLDPTDLRACRVLERNYAAASVGAISMSCWSTRPTWCRARNCPS